MPIINKEQPSDADLIAALIANGGERAGHAPASSEPEIDTFPKDQLPPDPRSTGQQGVGPGGDEDEDFATEAPATEDEELGEYETTIPPGEEGEFYTETPSELSALREELAELRMQMATQPQAPAEPAKPKPLFDRSKYVLTQEEMDNLLDNPALINDRFEAILDDVEAALGTQLQPEQVQTIVAGYFEAERVTNEFYERNPDLAHPKRKRIVAMVMQQEQRKMAASGQPVNLEKLMAATEREAREALGLPKPRKGGKPGGKGAKPQTFHTEKRGNRPNAKPAGAKPTLPGGKSGRKGGGGGNKPKPGSQRAMIDEMIRTR